MIKADFAANAAPMLPQNIGGHCATCGKCPTCGTRFVITGLNPAINANAAAMNQVYYTINGTPDPCRDCGK